MRLELRTLYQELDFKSGKMGWFLNPSIFYKFFKEEEVPSHFFNLINKFPKRIPQKNFIIFTCLRFFIAISKAVIYTPHLQNGKKTKFDHV